MRNNMKIATLLLLIALGATAQSSAATTKTPAKEAPKIEIPAAAVKGDDGAWRYTDPQGKKWIYRKTPFGIARAEDKPVDPTPVEVPAGIKATEDGDTIRFERPGPFGTYKWQRTKSDLNDMERAAWEREKSHSTAKQEF